ncbi:MAG: hypothetical protein QXT88_01915 [Desulfurococcaceae archaeon]|uniref:Uncharacterized protein n=1 Tax=Staphylothermus marinus TaxID=2280 RepID=A0A7C4NV79_STAMA
MGVSIGITGFELIDELLTPLPNNWIIEFYGDEFLVNYFFHTTLAFNSLWRRVYAVIVREYGGLDPGLLAKLCRIYGCTLTNIMVARAFRIEDLVNILKNTIDSSGNLIAILYPYSYLPNNPSSYWKATLITGLIHSLSSRNQVVLFNTVSKFGNYMSEGGSMHHHIVKIMVKLWRRRDLCYAKLVKHSGKAGNSTRIFRLKLLETAIQRNSKTLLEWIRTV